MYGTERAGVDCWGAGAGVKLALSKSKLDPRPAIRWPGAGGAVSVDERVAFKGSCRRWLSAGHGVAVNVVVFVAAAAPGRKAAMALSTQEMVVVVVSVVVVVLAVVVVATAFITSGTGYRGLFAG